EQLDVARRALAVAAGAVGGGDVAGFLYARVDVVTGNDGGVVVIELELTEPSLFLSLAPGSLDPVADPIAAPAARRTAPDLASDLPSTRAAAARQVQPHDGGPPRDRGGPPWRVRGRLRRGRSPRASRPRCPRTSAAPRWTAR